MEVFAFFCRLADAVFNCDEQHSELVEVEPAPVADAELVGGDGCDVLFGCAVERDVGNVVARVFDVPDVPIPQSEVDCGFCGGLIPRAEAVVEQEVLREVDAVPLRLGGGGDVEVVVAEKVFEHGMAQVFFVAVRAVCPPVLFENRRPLKLVFLDVRRSPALPCARLAGALRGFCECCGHRVSPSVLSLILSAKNCSDWVS